MGTELESRLGSPAPCLLLISSRMSKGRALREIVADAAEAAHESRPSRRVPSPCGAHTFRTQRPAPPGLGKNRRPAASLIVNANFEEVLVNMIEKSRTLRGAPARRPEQSAAGPRLVQAEKAGAGARDRLALVARAGGALALLAVGAVHIQQYMVIYSAIPTIGTLFVLNFAGATTLGLGLLAPVERLSRRWGRALVALLALGGIFLSATAYVFLYISERTPLFGFQEPGYDRTAILASRIAELTAIALLASFLVARFARKTPTDRR